MSAASRATHEAIAIDWRLETTKHRALDPLRHRAPAAAEHAALTRERKLLLAGGHNTPPDHDGPHRPEVHALRRQAPVLGGFKTIVSF